MGTASQAGPWASGASTAEAANCVHRGTWPPTTVKHRDKTLASVAAAARTSVCGGSANRKRGVRVLANYASAGGKIGMRDTAGSMIVAIRTMRCT